MHSLSDFNGVSSGWSVWLATDTVTARGARFGGCSERGGDFYLAIRGDIDLATCGDFFMAMENGPPGYGYGNSVPLQQVPASSAKTTRSDGRGRQASTHSRYLCYRLQ
jgi:hypothetical protein